jgi:hypothetical protein
MEHCINFLDTDFVVEYDYTVTYAGSHGVAPSLNDPGEPPEAMEFEVTILSIREDTPGDTGKWLELPEWLKERIAVAIGSDEDVYAIIEQREFH